MEPGSAIDHQVRHPPRSGWLDELDRLKGGGYKFRRRAVELRASIIRAVLLADVLADLLQFESNGRNGIAPSPEMLTGEIPFLAVQAGDRNGTLPFQESDHCCYQVLGWNRHAHMDVVWHPMPFQNLAFLLPR